MRTDQTDKNVRDKADDVMHDDVRNRTDDVMNDGVRVTADDAVDNDVRETAGIDREIRSAMQRDVEIPDAVMRSREEAFREIRAGKRHHRRPGHFIFARVAGTAACACAALLVFSGASYAVGADNLFSRSFARLAEATAGSKEYDQRKIEVIAENAEDVVADSGASADSTASAASAASAAVSTDSTADALPANAQTAGTDVAAETEGLTLRAEEYYCDGKILAVTLTMEDKNGVLAGCDFIRASMGVDSNNNPSLVINGQDLGIPDGLYFQRDDSGNFIALEEVNLRYYEAWNGYSFPDESTLQVQLAVPEIEAGHSGMAAAQNGSDTRKIQGNWAVDFSAVCKTGGNHVMTENQAAGDVLLNTVTRTPASVWVDVTVPETCNGIDVTSCGYAVNLVLADGTIVQPEEGMALEKDSEGLASRFGAYAWRFVNPADEHFTVLVRAKNEELTTLAEFSL